MGELKSALQAANEYYGHDLLEDIFKGELTSNEVLEKINANPNIKTIYNKDGSVAWRYLETEQSIVQSTSNIGSNINSNTTPATAAVKNRVKIHIPINVEPAATAGKYVVKSGALKTIGGVASKANAIVGAGSVAYAGASTVITLGKKIEKKLYNANPEFWDSIGMETLNPDTWGSIVNSDSTFDKLFRFIFQVEADGTATQYIEDKALGHLAHWFSSVGGYSESGFSIDENSIPEENLIYPLVNYTPLFTLNGINLHHPPSYDVTVGSKTAIGTSYEDLAVEIVASSDRRITSTAYLPSPYSSSSDKKNTVIFTAIDSTDKNDLVIKTRRHRTDGTISETTSLSSVAKLKSGDTVVRNSTTLLYGTQTAMDSITYPPKVIRFDGEYSLDDIAYILTKGLITVTEAIEGITNQPDATIPDLRGVTSADDVLNILREKMPQLFDNSMTVTNINDDGTTTTKTYIPVTIPELKNTQDTQPISGNQNQLDNIINEDKLPQTSTDTVTDTISETPTNPNPPDTGTGNTPTIITPSGATQGLYAIYNPTQTQLNAFGAWLWTDNFVEQIKKAFNNPMESIIGLHRIFATPSTGSSQNIQVGYLDSGVPSAIVTSQYTTIDCGSIDLPEYFGNVFDYSPYTEISLYLPFIGIVPLSPEFCMRSTISIKYHVDVLTGACLADVNITRDASGGVLYQYSGNCSVTYPVSSGSYMGIMSGVLGVAGSIAGILTGGSAMPLIATGAMSALSMHANVQHSGSFSGNAGAMGAKIPYLIISRPQTALPDKMDEIIGIPANETELISNLSGYTEFSKIIIKGLTCTKDELALIESQLLEGVYL